MGDSVTRFGFALVLSLLLVAVGCGSSNPRQLLSIDISASSLIDSVQFVSTGHFNQAPTSVSPLPVMWVVYLPHGESGPTIDQTGLAQCRAGVSGTFTILAYAPADPNIPVKIPLPPVKTVLGTTTMNCP